MKQLFLVVLACMIWRCETEELSSCEKDHPVNIEYIDFNIDRIYIKWVGTPLLYFKLKNKKTGSVIEKSIASEYSYTLVNGANNYIKTTYHDYYFYQTTEPSTDYILSIYQRCYTYGKKFELEFFKDYEFPSCQTEKIKNLRVEKFSDGKSYVVFDKIPSINSYAVKIKNSFNNSFENIIEENSMEVIFSTSDSYEISITPLCKGIGIFRRGLPETIKY